MPQIPFVGASYQERSKNLDAQACINLFPVLGESGSAKAVAALYGTPGTRQVAMVGDGPIRGLHTPTNGSDAIVISGSKVYRLSRTFVVKEIGSVDASSRLVGITDNGTEAVIVTGANGYVVDMGVDTVRQITDGAFYGASSIDILNTYMIFSRPNTNQFFISGANEVTFDALDFATAESNFEPIVRHLVNHSDLIFFKETVTEIWRSTGGQDFPFARDTNASIEQGCAAAESVVSMDNSVFWLGKNADGGGIVWRLNGYTPVRVSTDALESEISGYGDISDAQAFAYQQEGHTFYQLTFPSAGTTWVFDAATQLWHQRAYLNPKTGKLGRHRANCHMFYASQHVVGDDRSGRLFVLDMNYYSDNGDPMPAIRAAAHISGPDYTWLVHNRLQIDIETGVGLNAGQGSAPVVLLDWSDDGGHTWSSQRSASVGLIGQYAARVRWNRLGRARDRVYRVTITDPVKRVILGAALNPGQ